ncbi:MAG: hypothetical protein QW050_02660 [Candidatus Nitrosocaldaceae archaeon]
MHKFYVNVILIPNILKGKDMSHIIDEKKMKKVVKDALIEMMTEKKDLFDDLILEALEEVALGKTIREGRKDQYVAESKIMKMLER